ncbi:MAG: DUF4325 domain-containing protein [Spirochaetes bacterium]|jgi:hypothetical protein|nr:DUF4325 domain-containing protein [Spirochaetota bacterium]
MLLSIEKMAKSMKVDLPDLITRPTGRRFYENAIKKLVNVSADETVLCDFSGVEVIDPSFVDEFIVKLIKFSKTGEKPFFIRLKNFSHMVEDNIRSVFQSYCEFSNKKFSVITEDITIDNSHVIGIISEVERDIVEIIRINGTMSSIALSEYLHREKPETELILEEMYSDRLIKKDNSRFTIV